MLSSVASTLVYTGDKRGTAEANARECGILADGAIIEGPEYRRLSTAETNRILPELQVLAGLSPEDKRMFVKRLVELCEVVAITGEGTYKEPALRAADVGFSIGLSGTAVAKVASMIILVDDNFSSNVKALEWEREVDDSVKKFLQVTYSFSTFRLADDININAIGITFESAVFYPNEEPILTPVQLLWFNLIMDTFAACYRSTDSKDF
jgi:Ca2+-transporting ATPase